MKIGDILKFTKECSYELNQVIIGMQIFYLIEVKNKKKVLFDKLIRKLFSLSVSLYWFKDYYEFEEFFSIYNSNTTINFILIY